ncbi:MAG: ABC transporter ATP-binding protein [Microbacterium sp.]
MSDAEVPSGGISVRAVRRSFGAVHAVRDVTFHAAPGRVTGLVGPNGSGKTTLLLMLASLLRPDAGELRVGGVDPIGDPRAARAIVGWMPDALGAWPSLTARETLRLTGRLYGMTAAEAGVRAEALLETVQLAELGDQPARVLSRGQKQRLGLARALVHDPAVLLLDEPASGLDPQARVHLRELLRGFAAAGKTVLLSSHILSELEEVVDDAVFVVAGATVDAAPATTGGQWRVRALGPSIQDVAAAALGIDAGALRVDRGDLIVGFASDEAAADGLRALVTAGVPVVSFSPAVGSLERAFLDLPGPAAPRHPAAPPTAGGAA